MEATEINGWDDAAWFKRWLELARESQDENSEPPKTEEDEAGPQQEASPAEKREFAPPFAEWNFSVRECALLNLPRGVVASIT
ncbi:MAG: hypothetical protein JWR19_3803 [Pedosphaera sp.]|nr:hypothetical protein [Pedosphaera sp.]